MMPLNETQKKIIELARTLGDGRLENTLWHLELLADNAEMDREAREARKAGKREVFIGQGRIRAEYCARLRLSNAALDHRRAMQELDMIYENWEEMEKDAPVYWDDDNKLVGEVLGEDNEY